jgi:Flp pilus assembly protein TadB
MARSAEHAIPPRSFRRITRLTQTERQLKESAHDVGGLADQLAEARRQIADEHQFGRRKAWLAVMLVSCGCVLVVSLILALHVLAGATAVATLVVAKLGAEWIKDPERSARGFILAVLTESIGLIQIFVHW